MTTVKVWINPQEINHINRYGYPTSFSISSKEGLMEMSISTTDYQRWQNKDQKPMTERSNSVKQLLKD